MMEAFQNHGLFDWFDFYRNFALVETAATQRCKMKTTRVLITMAYYPQEPEQNF